MKLNESTVVHYDPVQSDTFKNGLGQYDAVTFELDPESSCRALLIALSLLSSVSSI